MQIHNLLYSSDIQFAVNLRMDNKDECRILYHNETEGILFPSGETSGQLLIVEQMIAGGFHQVTLRPKKCKFKG